MRALIKTAEKYHYEARILKSVESVNEGQKQVLAQKIIRKYGEDLSEKNFAVWGLAFKPETDDMREATSVVVIHELLKRGAHITAYDPKVTDESKKFYFHDDPGITYVDSKYQALKDADALLLITEWAEFRTPDFGEMEKSMKEFTIFDGRNQYSYELAHKYRFHYYQIGAKETGGEA